MMKFDSSEKINSAIIIMKRDPRGGYAPLPALVSRMFNVSLSLLLVILGVPVF